VQRLADAIEAVGRGGVDVVVLDLTLPDSTGLQGVSRLQAVAPSMPIVVLTGLQDESVALQSLRQGVQDYLVKGRSDGGLAPRALRYAVERRRVAAAVEETESRYRAVVEHAPDAIITIDERGVVESVNPATERMFGYTADELVGRPVNMLMPEPYASEHGKYVDRYLRTGQARIIGMRREVIALRKDGSTFPTSLSVSEFVVNGRRMFAGIHHDLSERRRLEAEVLEATANEQRRIGHDLHDGLCQQILGASFGIEVLARRLECVAPGEVPAVRKLAALLDESLKQARSLAHGLNPIDLRAGGLPKALEELAERIRDVFDVDCVFVVDGRAGIDDSAAATHLYRITQEAISNAIKHGRSRHIEIRLSEAGGRLTLSVSDDGVGLPADGRVGDGRGAHIMRYRAALLGATLAIRPGDAKGVTVSCSMRLPGATTGHGRGAMEVKGNPKSSLKRKRPR
jgi:two-component system sensor kinase FixL